MAKQKYIEDYYNPFAVRLRELMGMDGEEKEKKVKQKDLASYLDITPQSVGQYTDGKSLPTADKIIKMAKYFDVSTDYLLGVSNVSTYNADLLSVSNFLGISEKAVKGLKEDIDALTYNHFEQSEEYLDIVEKILSSDVALITSTTETIVEMILNRDVDLISNSPALKDNASVKFYKSNSEYSKKDMVKYYLFEELLSLCDDVLSVKGSFLTDSEKLLIRETISEKDINALAFEMQSAILKSYLNSIGFISRKDSLYAYLQKIGGKVITKED